MRRRRYRHLFACIKRVSQRDFAQFVSRLKRVKMKRSANDQRSDLKRRRFDSVQQTEQRTDGSKVLNYSVIDSSSVTSSNLRQVETKITVDISHNLKNFNDLLELEDEVDSMYEQLISSELSAFAPQDLFSCYIASDEHLNSPIFIPPRRIGLFNCKDFLNSVMEVAQSNEQFLITGKLVLRLSVTKNLRGNGKRCPYPITVEERNKRSHSTVAIDIDTNCLFHAVVLGIAYADDVPAKLKELLRKDRAQRRTVKAAELCSAAGLTWGALGTFEVVKQLQDHLQPSYTITVVEKNDARNRLFYGGPQGKNVYLQYSEENGDGHFDLITKMHTAIAHNRKFYCPPCHAAYKDRMGHKCGHTCPSCFSFGICSGPEATCTTCHRVFQGAECMTTHKTNYICQSIRFCPSCKTEHRDREKHQCDTNKCKVCSERYKGSDHYCFMKPIDDKTIQKQEKVKKVMVFFDIESQQQPKGNFSVHQPMLLVCCTVCDTCYDQERRQKKPGSCQFCGSSPDPFWGFHCVERFGDYLYQDLARRVKNDGEIVVLAHNSRGYDGHFLFNDILRRKLVGPKIIAQGMKLLRISVANVRIIDSLSFLPMGLSKLPKAFGLDGGLAKGFFPHMFNIHGNMDFQGSGLPAMKFFEPNMMMEDTRNEFLQWFENHKHQQWNFKEEILTYCTQDVNILMQAIMEYRKLFYSCASFDPLTTNFTLASLTLKTFRARHLQGDTIGITPLKPYSTKRRHSTSAMVWMDEIERQQGIKIKREYRIGPYWADGFCEEQSTVFEFYGCQFHFCPCIFGEDRGVQVSNCYGKTSSIQKESDKNADRARYFAERGFKLEEIWECQYLTRPRTPEQKRFKAMKTNAYREQKRVGPLHARDAFFGGRTNNAVLHYDPSTFVAPDRPSCITDDFTWNQIVENCRRNFQEKTVDYFDFTSLYPSVLKTKSFPIGHPRIDIDSLDCCLDFVGFVKCEVLPPKQLLFPVLPVRARDKLLFPLCMTCASDGNNKTCTHGDQERVILGTWTSMELKVALRKGYQLRKVYERHIYDETSTSMFTEYINVFLKLKQEASGFPSSCNTEESILEYITSYAEKEEIDLDRRQIKKNPGLRAIAKLMLNSLWGKLAQRANQEQTSICTEYQQHWDLLSDDTLVITGDRLINEHTALVTYRLKTESDDISPGNTSIAVAACVTAYARLELYREIESIEASRPGRVLYFDTDSIIFSSLPHEYRPHTGNFLGQMTDEIEKDYGPGSKIVAFVSGGPKNYGYQVRVPSGELKTVIKLKGVTLHHEAAIRINFDSMKNAAIACSLGSPLAPFTVPQVHIGPDPNYELHTRRFGKKYRVLCEKRIVLMSGRTLPYGWTEAETLTDVTRNLMLGI